MLFPGVLMSLDTGEPVNFKPWPVESAPPEAKHIAPQSLLLDGQQWHLGHADRKYWPRQRGFDYQYGPILGEIDYFTHSAHGTVDWYRNSKLVNEKGYVTTLLGEDAVRLINEHDPKLLYFSIFRLLRPMPLSST